MGQPLKKLVIKKLNFLMTVYYFNLGYYNLISVKKWTDSELKTEFVFLRQIAGLPPDNFIFIILFKVKRKSEELH